jgi:hypothetical protein
LLSDLEVEVTGGERFVEIEIALECRRRIAENAEEVRHTAEFGTWSNSLLVLPFAWVGSI